MNDTRHSRDDDSLAALSAPVDDATLATLHRRLEAAALAEGLLDVAYTTVDSPVGKLLLAATPKGLVRVAYATEDHDRVLADLAARLSPRVLHAPKRLDTATRELDEYFGPVALARLPPAGAEAPAGDRLRADPHLQGDGGTGGQPHGDPRRRQRLRDQPAARRRPVPPGAAHRRNPRRLHRGPRGQDGPAAPGGRRLTVSAVRELTGRFTGISCGRLAHALF